MNEWKISRFISKLCNISRSKGNQKIEFGESIEYKKRNILVKNHAQN